MNKNLKAEIARLKSDVRVWRTEEAGIVYGLLILDRGERMFVQQGDEGLICDVSARYSLIDPLSITSWDSGKKILEGEREVLLDKIARFYKMAYKDELTIYNKNMK